MSLSYTDDFAGAEGRYGLLPLTIAWSYCLRSQPCLLQECHRHFINDFVAFLSLQSFFPLPVPVTVCSVWHREVGCCCQRGWSGGCSGGSTAAKSLLCHWLVVWAVVAAPFSWAGFSLRQCPLGSWQPGASCGLWSSSCVASWPALCQSSKRLGANNRGIQSLELQL